MTHKACWFEHFTIEHSLACCINYRVWYTISMKFIGKTILKIFVYILVLIIPVTLLVTCFTLVTASIPLWNIGIRNILRHSMHFLLPSIFISYLIATPVVVSLVDKMKVRSLLLLHIPPIIAGGILGGLLFIAQTEEMPIFIKKDVLHIGVNTFFRREVFNEIGDRVVYIHPYTKDLNQLYLYNKKDGHLFAINRVNIGRRGQNYLSVDEKNRMVHIVARNNPQVGEVEIPFSSFKTGDGTLSLNIASSYRNQIVKVYRQFRSAVSGLKQRDGLILAGALFLSVLLISIPLSYGFNDRGWTFSGAAGVFLVLAALPYFYGFVLKILYRISPEHAYMGRYSYLVPALVFCIIGFILDILVKMGGRTRRV